MNLTYFHHKRIGNVGNKTTAQSTSDLSPKHKNFTENIRCGNNVCDNLGREEFHLTWFYTSFHAQFLADLRRPRQMPVTVTTRHSLRNRVVHPADFKMCPDLQQLQHDQTYNYDYSGVSL